MAGERLPFGEIRPGAKPIGAFVNPGGVQVGAAARPELLSAPKGINTIQQASGGNVQGFNQFKQIADALTPFNRELGQLMETGIKSYVSGQIDEGYYDQLKNLQVRSQMSLQNQAEVGAANAAGQVAQLRKIDPPAADLLQEANPWRAVGRRRALAQDAGNKIDDVLMDDLASNGGLLSGIAPGSGELTRRKADITNKILSDYGLGFDDRETAKYVLPSLNKAWDQYTDGHRKLYLEELSRTSAEATGGAVTGALSSMLKGGAPDFSTGLMVMPGAPGFNQAAGLALTSEIDSGLRVLAGDDRTKALGQIKNILGFLSRDPTMAGIVREVRLGDSNLTLDKRPRWIDANPVEYLETQNKGLQLVNANYEQAQQSMENTLDGLWYGEGGPGAPGVVMDSEDYRNRAQNFRQQALGGGYRDVDGYIQKKYGEGRSASEAGFGLTAEQQAEVEDRIRNLGPDAFAPEQIAATRAEFNAAANRAATKDERDKLRKQFQGEIDKKQKLFADMPSGTFSQIRSEIKRDFGLPEIKNLDPDGVAGSLLALPGTSIAGAMAAAPRKLADFSVQLENLYVRSVMAGMDEWRQKNPGIAEIPAAQQNIIVDRAIAKARLSDEYKNIYEAAIGINGSRTQQLPAPTAGGQSAGSPGGRPSSGIPESARGVPAAKASALPDTTVKAYAARPVMDGKWLQRELQLLNGNRPASQALYDLAKRANTSTTRVLLEQLRFYPQLDKDGSVGQFLQDKLQRERQQQTISSANFSQGTGMGMVPTGYNAFSPGSWLVNLIMPPAAAATMPTTTGSYGGGGGGGSFEKPSSVVYETRGGQPGVDLFFESKKFPAVLGGVVKDVSREPGYGNYVVVESIDPLSGRKVDVLYGHLADGVKLRPGQRVSPGQMIGQQGGTGNVRSADGTIASIDFFEARPSGSRDMTPFSNYDRLRRHVVQQLQSGGGSARPAATTRSGGGMTGLATYYNGSGGSDGVAGGPTANGERYNPNAMTAAVQWSLRGKYMNKWVRVEDMDTGKTVRVWVNDVGQMGGSERSINRSDPRVIDLSPAAFKKLFGSTQRGVGRIRILPG